MKGQASVPRDAFPPTPPGPEGSNGNGLLRVQWVAGAWLVPGLKPALFPPAPLLGQSRISSNFCRPAPVGYSGVLNPKICADGVATHAGMARRHREPCLASSGGVAARLHSLESSDLWKGMRCN